MAGRQRLGTGLVSLIPTLRAGGRRPVRTMQWYLGTVHGLALSGGAIGAARQRMAAAGQAAVAALQEPMRASPAVQADETGGREKGPNGYAGRFATPTAAYFCHGTRAGAIVATVLGKRGAGVLGSDFYAGSHHSRRLHQRCRVELLRDIHDPRGAVADRPGGAASRRRTPGGGGALEQVDPAPPERVVRVRGPPGGTGGHQGGGAERSGAERAGAGDQSQDQRRHAFAGGNAGEDDARQPSWRLAPAGARLATHLLRDPRFPASLNSFHAIPAGQSTDGFCSHALMRVL